ncbi:ATP-binding cassette sub-family C member 4-like [Bacillus rossius redtenbacheri]|uniref:ATP-binding cassette sub-family C member 4-like n=1 Tax=Bacillus rossius redtenbacheri TaxID=93214 RepID=UPI002FDC7B8A
MECGKKTIRPPHPRASANPLSALLFIWVLKVLRRGMRKELEVEDLFQPLEEYRSDYLGDCLESSWKTEINTKRSPSLQRAIGKIFLWKFLLYSLPLVVLDLVLRVAQPLLMGKLIRYFEPGSNGSLEEAYLNAFGILACSTFSVFMVEISFMALTHMGMKIRIAASSLIYRKALRLSQATKSETSVGQVINLLSNDVGRFDNCFFMMPYLVLGPAQAVIVTYFVWDAMGVAALLGVLVIVVLTPLQAFIGKNISAFRRRYVLRADERVHLMNEIVSGIQVIKLNAWEMLISKLVAEIRLNEIREMQSMLYRWALLTSFEGTTFFVALLTTVWSYILFGNIVTAEKVFVVTSFFTVIKLTVTCYMPRAMYKTAEVFVSFRRIQKFLLSEDLEMPRLHNLCISSSLGDIQLAGKYRATPQCRVDGTVIGSSQDRPMITVMDATVKWTPESDEYALSGINLKVTRPQLLAVIGPVGSGKTSLLLTLLRELPLTRGSIFARGEVSYASQEPWLFASSVRNNILFGEPYDRRRYQQVVEACALARDFEQLPRGDKTVVGDRGVTLSGGQRARINLARAVYKQADIYVLDDPLSAVDARVSRHLFESCICSFLKDKIRILVTNQLQFLSSVNHVIILNEGRMEAHGTYTHLQKSGLDFMKLLEDHGKDLSGGEGVSRGGVLHRSSSRRNRRRNVSIGSCSSSLDGIPSILPCRVVQETPARGKIALETYSSYFLASRRYFLVVVMALSELTALFLCISSNYWLSYWTNTETLRALQSTSVNMTINGTTLNVSRNSTYTTLPDDNTLMSRNLFIYVFASLILAYVIFALFKNCLYFFICMKTSVNLHNRMFSCVIRLPMRFFNGCTSGQVLNRFSKDVGAIDNQLPVTFVDCLNTGGALLVVAVLVVAVNPWVLAPTALVAVLMSLFRAVYLRTSRCVKRLDGVARSPVISHLYASLQGLPTIRAFKAQKMLQDEFDSHQDLHSSVAYLSIASAIAYGLWLDILCQVYITCVILGFFILGQGTLGGTVGLAISQSLGLTGMFQWFMRQSAELENQMTSVERVLEYCSLETEGELESSTGIKPPEHWPSQGRIVFKNVSLSYIAEEPPVLMDLNLTINPSEKVGIVGRTGAGKSSLISALFRLTHFQGSIVIDGVDTKTIGLHDLRGKISVIPQEPVLFSGPLRKNLDPFDQYSDDVLWSTLGEVELEDTVRALAGGLDHKVSEGGCNFSVGQRQLLCLAQVIVRNNKILVMDEATANIDPGTDALVQETVRRKFVDCTILTIAHRLLTVMDSDRIIVTDGGKVVEFDQPHILLQNRSGFLWSMVQETGKAMAEMLTRMAEKSYENIMNKKTC